MGNIGGYLGLFMGYSILQLPIMFHALLKSLEVWYHQLKSRFFPRKQLSFQINVKGISSSIDNGPLSIPQMENIELSFKSLSSSLSKLNEKIEFFEERLLKLETKMEESLVLKLNK